jgi:ferredoxin
VSEYRLRADRDRCIGSGACAFTQPAVFEQDEDDGRVVLTTDSFDAAQYETVRNAVDNCPVRALSLRKATS